MYVLQDVNDEKEVYDYLCVMAKRHDGLICAKCGLRRKYAKTYLKHISVCDGSTVSFYHFNDDFLKFLIVITCSKFQVISKHRN